ITMSCTSTATGPGAPRSDHYSTTVVTAVLIWIALRRVQTFVLSHLLWTRRRALRVWRCSPAEYRSSPVPALACANLLCRAETVTFSTPQVPKRWSRLLSIFYNLGHPRSCAWLDNRFRLLSRCSGTMLAT